MAREPQKEKPEEIDEPTLASESLTEEAQKVLDAAQLKVLQYIAVAISKDGMTIEESCMLANVPYEQFKALSQKYPVIQKIITLKELEYKRTLLKSLSRKARSGDDKVATFLLETRYPDEFGKKAGGGDKKDALGEMISFIQKNTDAPVVRAQHVPSQIGSMVPEPKKTPAQKLANFLV